MCEGYMFVSVAVIMTVIGFISFERNIQVVMMNQQKIVLIITWYTLIIK
jgi:hypothetical protein